MFVSALWRFVTQKWVLGRTQKNGLRNTSTRTKWRINVTTGALTQNSVDQCEIVCIIVCAKQHSPGVQRHRPES